MNRDTILEIFGVSANLTQEEAAKWSETAEECIGILRSRLKPAVVESQYENVLNAAAAKLLYYKVAMFEHTNGDSETFSAGDIKIKVDKRETIEIAKKIWLEAEKNIAHLLVDENFAFAGVGV